MEVPRIPQLASKPRGLRTEAVLEKWREQAEKRQQEDRNESRARLGGWTCFFIWLVRSNILPAGKRLHNYGKSQFYAENSTINGQFQ